LPLGHQYYLGMPEGELNPRWDCLRIIQSVFARITDSTQILRHVGFVPIGDMGRLAGMNETAN
jgi:hypothetical protein